MPRILVADDERPLRDAMSRFIKSLGMEAETVPSGDEALLRLDSCDLLLSDVRMPGLDGMSLLAEARKRRPQLPVVLLTGHGTVALAVEAMRAGATNFLTKPFDLDELEEVIRSALGRAPSKERPAEAVKTRKPVVDAPAALLGDSPAMQALGNLTKRVAKSEATVLVTGESGSGKEVVARTIHAASRRARMPFIAVNCGAIPENLLESELFGHVKGAFTGAVQARAGHFAAAEGGTLLLDEIGELPLHLQVKLLRVLQERAYTPIGESEPRTADVRVIAATNRDLESMVSAGTFREDLYYRLNVLSVAVPPLRERGPDDVILLARLFLDRAAAAESRSKMTFDDDVELCLRTYAWPGNVRELEHAITRATVLAPDLELCLADLPIRVRGVFASASAAGDTVAATPPAAAAASAPAAAPPAPDGADLPAEGVDLPAILSKIERKFILGALARTHGNRNKAAALLGLRRTTLVEKLKRFDPGEES